MHILAEYFVQVQVFYNICSTFRARLVRLGLWIEEDCIKVVVLHWKMISIMKFSVFLFQRFKIITTLSGQILYFIYIYISYINVTVTPKRFFFPSLKFHTCVWHMFISVVFFFYFIFIVTSSLLHMRFFPQGHSVVMPHAILSFCAPKFWNVNACSCSILNVFL